MMGVSIEEMKNQSEQETDHGAKILRKQASVCLGWLFPLLSIDIVFLKQMEKIVLYGDNKLL